MSNIPTTPAVVTMSQVQVFPVVCQPQVSQVAIQQPLVSTTPPQSSISGSLTGVTQAQTGTITPHLGQTTSIGQQQMVSQPWLVQYQQLQFQQVYQGSKHQVFASNGQLYIQNGQHQPFHNGYAHQPYQSY